MSQELHCTRCGNTADRLYDYDFTDEDGEEVHQKLCWDCDFDVINGGDISDDAADIHADRAERAYEYDPINNPRPW